MIRKVDTFFVLETKELSYIIDLLPSGHLEHVYFGNKTNSTLKDLKVKLTAGAGSQVEYSKEHPILLDLLPLEYSGIGKGDYRKSPLEIKMPNGSFVTDFLYDSYEIITGSYKSTLPNAEDATKSLIITLLDKVNNVSLKLIYSVFYESNIITRRVVLSNHNENKLVIRKIMSMMLDIYDTDYELISFEGGWIKEAHKTKRAIGEGSYILESTTGSSSNKTNPGFILAKKDTHEDYGVCYGVNLVYSGNHYSLINISNHGNMRVMTGINPHTFEWELNLNESFETPEAVITYSSSGYNKLSNNMHNFINNHIVPKPFRNKERPIVLNNWESHMFDFNARKLKHLAKRASKVGVELFVLDDGWFGERDDDTKGLGDYFVNKKKLPRGLLDLSKKVNKYKMDFGLWFEPEMVNENSKLYEKHPMYAVKVPSLEPSLGRNQLVLDLCNKDVLKYIKENLKNIINSANITYIKWDMNRHISDMYSNSLPNQGMFFHSYILGLYDILKMLKDEYPNILLETCSSGGNRFDLGMLFYGPQIWTSDNTDPVERLKIQEGLSYLYPLSTISAHVSESPHAQTIRNTPLDTRFNVAAFGVFGYELDLKYLKPYEIKMVKEQIKLYKKYRNVFQFGTFKRFNTNDNNVRFQVSKDDIHILGRYQMIADSSPNLEKMQFKGLKSNQLYDVKSYRGKLNINRFGHLIKHAINLPVRHDGFIMRQVSKYYTLDNAKEEYRLDGSSLNNGVFIKQQFMGTYYNEETRLLSDYGSELYIAEAVKDETN